jgi:dihydroneopterin aldolase
MNLIESNIFLQGLELDIFLGWPDEERRQKQKVSVDIKIHYDEPPLACTTDNLEDTTCYDSLINTIKENILHREFHLLEYLGREIYLLVKNILRNDALISIWINKKHPFENIANGITFFYGDKI